jgi:hypothetical protein
VTRQRGFDSGRQAGQPGFDDFGIEPRALGNVSEIGQQAVGNVDRRARQSALAQRFPQWRECPTPERPARRRA